MTLVSNALGERGQLPSFLGNGSTGASRSAHSIPGACKLGMRRMATVRVMGMKMEWGEHPYEWIEGRRLSVLRQFPSGPFFRFTNVVELNPQSDGGTLVVQTIEMLPRYLTRPGRTNSGCRNPVGMNPTCPKEWETETKWK